MTTFPLLLIGFNKPLIIRANTILHICLIRSLDKIILLPVLLGESPGKIRLRGIKTFAKERTNINQLIST
jgi:hypothetical protein